MIKVKVEWQRFNGVTLYQARSISIKEMIGHQEINCHIIFDICMDFQQKSGFLVGGHATEGPNSIMYSSVVSRDSICIGFLLAYIYGVDITDIDLDNKYLNAQCVNKIWSVGGKEYREDKGHIVLFVRNLYGLKSAGSLWRSALAKTLREIGLKTTMEEPKVWIRAEMRMNG